MNEFDSVNGPDYITQSINDLLAAKKLKRKEIAKGMGLVVLFHLVWVVFPFAYLTIGLGQILYVVPLALYLHQKGKIGMAQGVWIAAALTFLLNATCFGIVMLNPNPPI
jgi:hypothetical protein